MENGHLVAEIQHLLIWVSLYRDGKVLPNEELCNFSYFSYSLAEKVTKFQIHLKYYEYVTGVALL